MASIVASVVAELYEMRVNGKRHRPPLYVREAFRSYPVQEERPEELVMVFRVCRRTAVACSQRGVRSGGRCLQVWNRADHVPAAAKPEMPKGPASGGDTAEGRAVVC